MHLKRSRTTDALIVAGLAVVLTIAFHLFFAEHPYGIPFALFITLLTSAIFIVAKLKSQHLNLWACLFLLPVALCVVAEIFFAGSVVRILGFTITFISLGLFACWITLPRISFRQVRSLWTPRLFREALLPFSALPSFFVALSTGKKSMRILIGILFALPLLFMIGWLFVSSDPLIRKLLTDLFQNWSLPITLGKTIRDLLAAIFFVAAGWIAYERMWDVRRDEELPTTKTDPTILTTILALLNLLFVVFLVFQFSYFFGNENLIQRLGLTYADYARSGFFQLLVVAGIVFAFLMLIYPLSRIHARMEKILSLVLIVQTYIVMLSATKRLLLYINAYGLTLSRWWAMICILIIACVLTFVGIAILTRARHGQLVKLLTIFILCAFSIPLLLNAERRIAESNIQRFTSGDIKRLDLEYLLFSLSSDAIPPIVEFRMKQPVDKGEIIRENVYNELSRKREELLQQSSDWRHLVISDYAASKALERIK